MIIDMHRHMWSVGERHHAAFAGLPQFAQQPPPTFDWEQTTQEIVAEMDSARVDRSVLFVADFAARLGDAPFPIHQENELVVKARQRYPERIIAYYGIDPRRPGAADSFERAIKEWGITGIKLHPSVGFYPHDRVCYPIYELCVHYDIPVLFHTGPGGFNPSLYNRFTHPLEYDQVASDLPNLTIIMGHASGDWWSDGIIIARGHPRMLLELSEWQLRLKEEPQEAIHALSRMRNALGIERLMWGTDFPGARRRMALKECVEVFRRLPQTAAKYETKFTEQEANAILGDNAARLLKLP